MPNPSTTESNEIDVTVAVTHPFTPVFEVGVGDPPQGASWAELPKTTISVQPEQTLREILRAAGRELKVAISREVLEMDTRNRAAEGRPARSSDPADWLVFAGFHREDDDEVVDRFDGIPIRRWNGRLRTRVLVVRDGEGRAVWRRPPFEATLAELLDAQASGLLEGEAREIYLVPVIPQGDLGLGGEWQHFLDNLKVLWEVTDAVARVGGAASALYWLKTVLERRSRRAEDAIERHGLEWKERGASPADLVNLIAAAPRSTEQIAALLGCGTEEAEAILWALGCVFEKGSGLWRYRSDAAAELIADDVSLGFTDVLADGKSEARFREMAKRRLRRFAEHGSAPSLREDRRKLRDAFFAAIDEADDGWQSEGARSKEGVVATLQGLPSRAWHWFKQRWARRLKRRTGRRLL